MCAFRRGFFNRLSGETVEKPQGCGISEGKIVTKDRSAKHFGAQPPRKAAALSAEINHQGCLSCMIISFENFLRVSKLAAAGQKHFFDTLER